jgi:uncharacterized membrane protein
MGPAFSMEQQSRHNALSLISKGAVMADTNAAATSGLTDDAASGIAYLTIIPAIIFLVVAPYNTNPKVKFHAWQSIFLGCAWIGVWIILAIIGVIPGLNLLDLVLFPIVGISFLVLWLIAMIQAFTGKRFSIPVIGGFAAKQAGA